MQLGNFIVVDSNGDAHTYGTAGSGAIRRSSDTFHTTLNPGVCLVEVKDKNGTTIAEFVNPTRVEYY